MLVESMKDTPYVFFSDTPYRFFGEHTTYWGLYFGWGLLVPVLLLTLAVVLWILSGLTQNSARGVGAVMRPRPIPFAERLSRESPLFREVLPSAPAVPSGGTA